MNDYAHPCIVQFFSFDERGKKILAMSATLYNAIVKKPDGSGAKYRGISNLQKFVSFAQRNFSCKTIFFYNKKTKKFCGVWTVKNGFNF